MATEILIKHKESGLINIGYYGFSRTYLLFFGWFVPLFRGEHCIYSPMKMGATLPKAHTGVTQT